MPEKAPERAEEEAGRDAVLQALLEVKEGCRTSGRREVLARTSVPGLFSRYLHLAGACADARGLEREFWTLYRLKCAHVGRAGTASPVATRVFTTRAAKHAALAEEARETQAAECAPLVAVRTPAEAQAIADVLAQTGSSGALTWVYPAQRPLPEGRPAHLTGTEEYTLPRAGRPEG